jgi:hypothetical protein
MKILKLKNQLIKLFLLLILLRIISKNYPKKTLLKPNFRKYTNNKFKKTDNAYVSLIFGDETYIPALLILGYSLRKYKCKYNLVCMVQDKPTKVKIDNELRHFPGVSNESINQLLKYFRCCLWY